MLGSYPDVLSIKDLCEILHLGKNKVYELLNKKVIGSHRIGKKYLVPKSCLIAFLRSAQYNVMK